MVKLSDEQKQARNMICLPLDGLNTMEEFKDRVDELSDYVGVFKIGKESFTRFGPAAVELVQKGGADVFLDLKYHDIPNTVEGSAKAAAEMGVYTFNVHTQGGTEMMKAAMEGAHSGAGAGRVPYVTGVTVLTSIDQQVLNSELKVPGTISDQVLHLAGLANNAGLHGIVCAALDLPDVTPHLPEGFMYVTPGIKGPQTQAGADQKRVATPYFAASNGSKLLVIGRAITGGATPEERQENAYSVINDIARHLS